MSGSGTPTGTNFGTATSTMPANVLTFEAAVQNDDQTPPEVSFTGSSTGSITVGAYMALLPISQAPGYQVTASGLSVGTTIVEIAGDNIDDGYVTAVINPAPNEDFTVNPASIALNAPTNTDAVNLAGTETAVKSPQAAGTPIKSPTAAETLPKPKPTPTSGTHTTGDTSATNNTKK